MGPFPILANSFTIKSNTMQKTLGGDRLGAGKKMKVHLHGYERSTHDMGYLWRSTMAAGTLVPFLCELALPGDTFDIDLDLDTKTHPTIGPLFGSYKAQLDIFQAPVRLYNAALHNNALNIGRNMSAIKLPQIELPAAGFPLLEPPQDIDNSQINPSSLPAYVGIRGIGEVLTDTEEIFVRQFCAIPILMYYDTYKNYYANKQEEIGAVLHTPIVANVETIDTINVTAPNPSDPDELLAESPATSVVALHNGALIKVAYTGARPIELQVFIKTANNGFVALDELTTPFSEVAGLITLQYNWAKYGSQFAEQWRYQNNQDISNGTPQISTFPLENIDTMRRVLLAHDDTVAVITDASVTPYGWLAGMSDGKSNLLSSQEGLALKTYQSDLFNNWLSTEWIDGAGGITEMTSIDTSGGSFSIDTLNLSRKVYNMLNRIAVSGGSYDDWLDAVYAHDRYQRCETPMYMGGLSKELVFSEVVSNSESEGENGTQPLGTLAGKGVLARKHKGGKVIIKVDEPSYIMGIISYTPRLDYSQGNKWDTHLKTMDDFHKPALDEIGFQELITEQMAWWSTSLVADETVTLRSAGKQPAWINYMTNVNQVRGNFAIRNNEMFMTLNRRYEYDNTLPGRIADLTTYIDPSKYNQIFAETSLDSQNFWTQIAVDMTVRRKMSAKLMPNL